MQVAAVLVFLVICELCFTIRVPVIWDESASEVKQEIKKNNDEQFSVESFQPQNVSSNNVNKQNKSNIPVEYFEYTAKKPQFAINIAKFHGVQTPENHYKAYPINPYTGTNKPDLGKHHIFDHRNVLYKPFQEFADINKDDTKHVVPVSSNYEVFHPYEAETPALQEIYKDPILNKIRNDLESSKNNLQAYEKDAGEPNIQKDEYLESPKQTDDRFVPQRNIPVPYEIHRPQKRPLYYRPSAKNPYREHYLNQRLRHPWNQYSAKIRPVHYRPIKNHLHHLRQNHALKYDDERNEYPQVHILENYSSDPKDGYDIYEKGKEKFGELRNNVDESINKAARENRPIGYKNLEMQNEDHQNNNSEDGEEEFVPIKNYAQVRRTETYKHLPRSAALADAENLEEIRNAPRLREAVKSTKAQTVYSEEGYEDSGYDHAGEHKHASENEGHGGYLKEHELSQGKYKTPSENAKYEDEGKESYRDQVIHAEKWNDDNLDNKEVTEEEDYEESEEENQHDSKENEDSTPDDVSHRNKRENVLSNDTNPDLSSFQAEKIQSPIKNISHNAKFEIPELDLKSTFLTKQDILDISKLKVEHKQDKSKQKYPYYYKNLKIINEHSPLRYAENLESIPKKSNGGTEFYDSRSNYECPEVEEVPNPIPKKLNREGHPDDDDNNDRKKSSISSKGDENYDTANKTPRLSGLGDKIDCFKAKYFGENPLDSPFFSEESISNPEPIVIPNNSVYKLHHLFDSKQDEDEPQNKIIYDKTQNTRKLSDIKTEKNLIKENEKQVNLAQTQNYTVLPLVNIDTIAKNQNLHQQTNVYTDVRNNIENNILGRTHNTDKQINIVQILTNATKTPDFKNVTYKSYQNKDDIIVPVPRNRSKRSTSFMYEPYKIIREGQIQDSKKTTTSGNVSPLIKKLQSSRIVDIVPKFNQDLDQLEKPVKRNVNSRNYKEIDKKDRELEGSKNDKVIVDPTFVDISVDSRRGEPRYEIRHSNHKSIYTPIQNKKSMSMNEYNLQTSTDKASIRFPKGETSTIRLPRQNISSRKLILVKENQQTIAEPSNNVKKITTLDINKPTIRTAQKLYSEKNAKTYDEYVDDDENDDENKTISTTTQKPIFRRKIRLSTTTEKAVEMTDEPKLKLVTRFRNFKPHSIEKILSENTKSTDIKLPRDQRKELSDETETIPNYREKKKKTTKSTLVTDTKRYGDENDDDDDMKTEVDAMIHVNHDMDDYIPLYEKQNEKHTKMLNRKNIDTYETDRNEKSTTNTEEDNNDSHGSEEDVEEDDDEEKDDDDEDNIDVDEEDDDEEESEEEEDDKSDEDFRKQKVVQTTPEPTKRTLAITTDTPVPTIASRNTNHKIKPIVTRKEVQIHKELPINKSSPHITQFKQDIKEVEITKEIPKKSRRIPQKNLEALELYKDDNLAKDVNKLGGVEIFKEEINLKNGPRHGGNYRSLDDISPNMPIKNVKDTKKEDTETSQTEFTKNIELEEKRSNNNLHGGNLRSLNDSPKYRSRSRNSKLIELSDSPSTSMHGGNLKYRGRSRNMSKNQKLIELDEEHDDDDDTSSSDHESFSNTGNSGQLHGGNYQRGNLRIQAQDKPENTESEIKSKKAGIRRNSAAILNSFVQAVPILTTTPAYILDPSKRMYYYVDA